MQTRFISREDRKKYSTPIWRGQAIFFGWLKINKTFTKKEEAIAWYDRYLQGYRYRHAVAVLWQGCKRNTPEKFLKDALCGGEEWKLVRCQTAKSQEQCDYILNSSDYEYEYIG